MVSGDQVGHTVNVSGCSQQHDVEYYGPGQEGLPCRGKVKMLAGK